MIEDEAKAEVARAFKAGTDADAIIAVCLMSIAISQKRQADSMDRLEKAGEAQQFIEPIGDGAFRLARGD